QIRQMLCNQALRRLQVEAARYHQSATESALQSGQEVFGNHWLNVQLAAAHYMQIAGLPFPEFLCHIEKGLFRFTVMLHAAEGAEGSDANANAFGSVNRSHSIKRFEQQPSATLLRLIAVAVA